MEKRSVVFGKSEEQDLEHHTVLFIVLNIASSFIVLISREEKKRGEADGIWISVCDFGNAKQVVRFGRRRTERKGYRWIIDQLFVCEK
jgi:hypothetical protein